MNIVLIGMPGAGKSTVGVILAKSLGYRFVDSDLIIQERYNKLLSELIAEHGEEGFRKIENDINASLELDRAVIATGGSVVYGEEAMRHLKENAIVVYLEVSYKELDNRVRNFKSRGIVTNGKDTMEGIYKDRVSLYEKYADIVIHENSDSNHTIGDVLEEIRLKIAEFLN